MHTEDELTSGLEKLKGLLIVGVLFLVSCFLCYRELIYLFRGETIVATVTRTYEVTRGADEPLGLTVEYAFHEPSGIYRTDSVTVAPDWEMPASGKVYVEYTPGKEGRSRLAGDRNWFGIIFFVLSLGGLIFGCVWLWVKAGEATRERKPARKK
jgi:hypothetical protein